MPQEPQPKKLSQEWHNYQYACELKAHLKALSKAVLEGKTSAALAFAIQSEGIIDDGEVRRRDRI